MDRFASERRADQVRAHAKDQALLNSLVEASLDEVGTDPSIPRSFLTRPRRIMEGEFEGWEAPKKNFGSPSQPARAVKRDRKFVSCHNTTNAAIKAITGADPVATIQAANTRAIKLLDKAITDLQATRKSIRDDGATTAIVSGVVRKALQDRFKMNANDRTIWTSRGGRIDVLIRRIRGVRQILADGWMKYTCLGATAPATVTISRGGKRCTVVGCEGEVAFTCGGNSHIVLCKPWWSESLKDQAGTLLHECFHIYFFGIIRDTGNLTNAHCYEQFVLDLNGLAATAGFETACP